MHLTIIRITLCKGDMVKKCWFDNDGTKIRRVRRLSRSWQTREHHGTFLLFQLQPKNLQWIALNSGRDMEFSPTLLADMEDMLTHSILILI